MRDNLCLDALISGVVMDPHRQQLHMTLAYQYDKEQHERLLKFAKEVDLNADVKWELRLYSRDSRAGECEVNIFVVTFYQPVFIFLNGRFFFKKSVVFLLSPTTLNSMDISIRDFFRSKIHEWIGWCAERDNVSNWNTFLYLFIYICPIFEKKYFFIFSIYLFLYYQNNFLKEGVFLTGLSKCPSKTFNSQSYGLSAH